MTVEGGDWVKCQDVGTIIETRSEERRCKYEQLGRAVNVEVGMVCTRLRETRRTDGNNAQIDSRSNVVVRGAPLVGLRASDLPI